MKKLLLILLCFCYLADYAQLPTTQDGKVVTQLGKYVDAQFTPEWIPPPIKAGWWHQDNSWSPFCYNDSLCVTDNFRTIRSDRDGIVKHWIKTWFSSVDPADSLYQGTLVNQCWLDTINLILKCLDADNMQMQNNFAAGIVSQPTTVWVVMKSFYTGVASMIYIDGIDAVDRVNFHTNGGSWRINAAINLINGVDDVAWNIQQSYFNGANSRFSIDGVSKITGNAGANALAGITINDRWDVTGVRSTQADYKEILIIRKLENTKLDENLVKYFIDIKP